MSDFFFQLPKKKQHIIAFSILFLIPFILFFQTTLGGKTISRHDITQWRAAANDIIEYREKYNEEPLWTSNMFGGMPTFAISTKQQTPHISDLKYLILSIAPAFPYWILLSGMYVLLTLIGFRTLTSVCGSIILGITTYFPVILMAGHNTKFSTLGFVPWTIAGYWLLFKKENKKPEGLLLFTIALALQFRAGHPQMTYYFMFLLGGLWLLDTYAYLKNGYYKKWASISLLLIFGGIVGFAGHADGNLSMQSYSKHTIRGGSDINNTESLDINYAFAWSQGISETITIWLPDAFGGASPDYWGPKTFTSGPHYFGALSLLLLLIALFKVKDKTMYAFIGVGLLGIFFSWGNNLSLLNNFAFNYIPFFNKFRAPETWLVLTSFCNAVIVSYGLNYLIDKTDDKTLKFNSIYKPLAATIGVLLFLAVIIFNMDYSNQREIEAISNQIAQQNNVNAQHPQVRQRANQYVSQQLRPKREEKAKGDLFRLVILLSIGIALIYAMFNKKISASTTAIGFALLFSIDLITVAHRYMDNNKFVDSNIDAEKEILSQRRDIDAYIQKNIDNESPYPYRVFPLMDNYFSNAIPSYFYPSLGGYNAAKLSVAQNVLQPNGPLFRGESGLNIDLLALLNTKYITYRTGLIQEGLSIAFEGQGGVVYEVNDVLPKAFFVDSIISVESGKEALDYLEPGRINFATTAVVENFENFDIQSDSTDYVNFINYRGANMTLQLSRNAPGFLVLSEIYYPDGWIATLNGKEIPIHKTNYLLRGLKIPQGNHELILEFKPQSYYIGGIISWISLSFQILLALYVGFIYWNKKTENSNE